MMIRIFGFGVVMPSPQWQNFVMLQMLAQYSILH